MPEHDTSPGYARGPTPEKRSQEKRSQEKPVWASFKAFMKVHWRITLAIFCSIGVLVMPFADEDVPNRVGGTLFYAVAAVVFWTLHLRHRAGAAAGAGQVAGAGQGAGPARSGRPGARVTLDTSIEDGWSRQLLTCREKADVFREVGAATRSEPVRAWLSSMTEDIERQLVQAEDLAALGRSVEPGFTGRGEPSHSAAREAWNRLGQFESGLDDAVTGAAEVRMNSLSPAADFDAIRGQLDMLKTQLPTLDTN